jgi:RNA recognition motif-containing protein
MTEVFMSSLFLSNVPHDCEDAELLHWVEMRGFAVDSVRIVRDMVAGVSPGFGYVALRDNELDTKAIKELNGQNLKGRPVEVKKDWRKAAKHKR